MKITCPKCQAAYKIDLPDPSEAGIDVQCGKCLYIFQFSPDSDLPEGRPSEPILPPQKDEYQEISDSKKRPLQSKKQTPSSPGKDRETSEELELEPILYDHEPIEIIIENETPGDSLEKEALEDIWDQAVQEGARTIGKSKKTPPPPVKKSKRLPSLEDRQREIDRMIADHQAEQGESGEKPPAEKSQPSLTQKDLQQEKTQEEIDLEEQVVINEGEATPNWEEAFAHQSEVEAGWKKAQEQDRILEEQQLAEALGKKALPKEPSTEEKAPTVPQEDKQSVVDEIFAEVKGSQEAPKEIAKTPQPEPEADQKQEVVGQIFAEAKAQREKIQEEIDLEKQVTLDQAEAMPSWEEAFADQSEVETGWRKAQAKDRIHEEQQLADALGEEYIPSEPPAEETPVTQENKQNLVDQLFAEAQSQQETAEPPEAITQDEPLEVSGEKVPSSEIQETHVDQHTIPGGIDLMTDLDDLNMKELVTQAFKEASESQEKTERSTPETTTAETPQEEELEMEPLLETAGTPAEAETVIMTFPIEMKSEPEVEPEPEPEMELEPEPEMEPELTMESQETTVPSAEQPTTSQGSSYDDEADLWANLLPEYEEEAQPVDTEAPTAFAEEEAKEETQPVDAEAPVAFSEEEGEEPFGGNDFWDQVLEKESEESQTAETEAKTEPQPVASAPVAQDTAEREALTDEELWKQAFPGEEEFQPTTPQYSGEKEDDSKSKVAPLVIGANVKTNEDPEDSLKYDDAAYADYDDDDEFEFQRRKRKLGPFTLPHGRRGDWVIGGAMVVFLLLAGSAYFILQTFAPGELTDIQTAKTDEVPEGLSPRDVPLDEPTGDLTSPKPPKPEKTPTMDTPGDKGEAILSDPSKILEESPEEKGILKDLAESQILKDTGKSQTAKINQSALQTLTGHSVTMSTIMPVAYNPTDIRVLSFSVEMQLSDAQSAKMMRESLPVYEEIMNRTVEDLLRRKFYNDVLYVKEKLQKRLQTAMNKSLKNGRVRKTKFVDFAIQ